MEIQEAIRIEEYKCETSCPNCSQKLSVAYKNVVEQDVVECDICGQMIKLVDQEGATKRFVAKINRLLNNLDKELGLLDNLPTDAQIKDYDTGK